MGLSFTMDLKVRLIMTVMSLHNYCVDSADDLVHTFITSEEEEEVMALVKYWTTHTSQRMHGEVCDTESLRAKIISDIEEQGLCRPN